MRKRINASSYVEIKGNKIKLTISGFSFGKAILVLIMLIIPIYVKLEFSVGNEFPGELFIIICGLFIYHFYSLFHFQKIYWDLTEKRILRYSLFMGIRFKSEEIMYHPQSEFLYENVYNEYHKITQVWLVARAGGGIIKEKLFYFDDVDSFIDFKRVFNDWRPENKILEWHG